MSRIKSKDTKPEIIVRKTLYKLGFRYGLYKEDLPGKPDIIFLKKKIAIFVNGCFWHQHEGCKRKSSPKTNTEYWEKKLKKNVENQNKSIISLRKTGWKVFIIWECETKDSTLLEKRIKEFLYE
jgi:DNA mismatch endonuclease (patch repair protein)